SVYGGAYLMTDNVRGNFYRQVWHVLFNDETMQIVAYIEVCVILMVVMFNTSYLVLQAMTMWGNDRRMKFVG
ncbi:hypothetical protein ACJX0J_028286, partial [Zea mays]